MILTKEENIKNLLLFCRHRNVPIKRKDLEECSPRSLQIARRAIGFHGVVPRLVREILEKKRVTVRPHIPPVEFHAATEAVDFKKRAANDDS